MNTRELFKRAVIESIHGLPYEEAIEKEYAEYKGQVEYILYQNIRFRNKDLFREAADEIEDKISPITLSRVFHAFQRKGMHFKLESMENHYGDMDRLIIYISSIWDWTDKDGVTLEDDDQIDECIEKLYELIK